MLNVKRNKLHIALYVVTALIWLPAPALAAEDKKPDPIGEFNQKSVVLSELQKQLETLLRRHAQDPETRKQIAAIQMQMSAVRVELATLALQAGKPELAKPLVSALRDLQKRRLDSEAADNGKSNANQNKQGSPDESSVENRTVVIKDAPEDQLGWTREELIKRERQLAELNAQMAKLERERSLPPLPGAEVKVFQLAKSPVNEAAHTIESLFGAQTLRVATDERTNSLIVLGAADSLASVEALLGRMDQQNSAGASQAKPPMNPPRSLLLRIFWLADGLPKDEGQNADEFLPKAVLAAVDRLGLSGPRLVTQTVNSLAAEEDQAVEYSINVPAIVFKQPTNLSCAGHMRWSPPENYNSVNLETQVNVIGQAVNCQLSGSMFMPLDHYMVLGTANSVIADPATVAAEGGAPGAMMGPGMGMMMRGAPGGMAGGIGRPGAAAGPEGGVAFGAEGAAAGAAAPQASAAKYNTSHFAFVVQVVEGESFAPDNQKKAPISAAPTDKKTPASNKKTAQANEEDPFGG